jgi:HK97 gp10 family phage protein
MITAQADPRQIGKIRSMLINLPKKIRNKILREEMRKAAKTLVAPAKAATPVLSGKLRKSVKVRAAKKLKQSIGVTIGYSEKPFTGDTFYGAFLEWGWRIGKRPSRAKRATDTRTQVPGRRMLGNVAESKGPGLLSRLIVAIGLRIQREARNV